VKCRHAASAETAKRSAIARLDTPDAIKCSMRLRSRWTQIVQRGLAVLRLFELRLVTFACPSRGIFDAARLYYLFAFFGRARCLALGAEFVLPEVALGAPFLFRFVPVAQGCHRSLRGGPAARGKGKQSTRRWT
jgi:hypothetical protein